jgi:uncharacterized protein YeaO (DUF488 family)
VTLRIVRLGEPRHAQEGTRIGTVRRPPRGVRKSRYAADDWFDVWYPDIAPSAGLMTQGQVAATEPEWKRFVRAFKAEMNVPTASTPDARPSGGALARQQLIYRLLLRERGPLPPVCASRTTDEARRESRLNTVATVDFVHWRSGFRTARVPPLGLHGRRHLTSTSKGISNVRSSVDHVPTPQ